MNKVICDVCGTAYPETASVCPICNSARRTAEQTDAASTTASEVPVTSRDHVKGGRFSKKNVRKRSKVSNSPVRRHDRDEEEPSNTGLIIVVILLLLAIVAVVIYLALKLFWPVLPPDEPIDEPQQNVDVQPETEDKTVSCESLTLDVDKVSLEKVGDARMIYVTVSPANTTDEIVYASSNENVVTVTERGKVVAVGPGEATITIICGSQTITCDVICSIEEPTEETTEAPTEETTVSLEEFRLNREDITMSFAGEKWKLYSGEIDLGEITWTSNNEAVAKISFGTVEAVGPGTTTVHGEYGGVKVSCIIRCVFSDSEFEGVGGHGGVGEDG